jgi:hypothetical protein
MARQSQRAWLHVRYDDLARYPMIGFVRIDNYLGLEYAPGVRPFPGNCTRRGTPAERADEWSPTFVPPNSGQNLFRWAVRLNPEDVAGRKGAADVWPQFYAASERDLQQNAPPRKLEATR